MTTKQFQKIVWDYYAKHRRDLPWRKNINPYRILVSEVMLQQTQVSRVIPKYRSFLKLFPNWKALAHSPSRNVLAAWSGLGYNRRALYLKRAAEIVVKNYNNQFPSTAAELTNLPGVGKNTAGAILAYAFNQPVVFVETNIRKVFLHHFFPKEKSVSDNALLPIIAKALDKKNPQEWYWALMDYGTFLSSAVENPSRRSRHYTKQSKFEGSARQLRGQILRRLLLAKKMSLFELEKQFPDQRLGAVIEALKKENFIVARGKSIIPA